MSMDWYHEFESYYIDNYSIFKINRYKSILHQNIHTPGAVWSSIMLAVNIIRAPSN